MGQGKYKVIIMMGDDLLFTGETTSPSEEFIEQVDIPRGTLPGPHHGFSVLVSEAGPKPDPEGPH